MNSDKLPLPIEIKESDFSSLQGIIDYVYTNYFKDDFMDKDNRTKLFGRFIFLDLNFINFKPERFWHIISFKAQEEKYTVNPCVNSNDSLMCKELKSSCDKSINLFSNERLENRSECLYRIRRINWINIILDLANKKDDSIKLWYQDERDNKNNKTRKVFIRFQDGLADYLIILIDGSLRERNNYKFVTAYPVVHNGTKRNLDKNYNKFK